MKKTLRLLPLLLACVLALAACADQEDREPETTTLIYANLTEGGVDRGAVNRFNRTHKQVQIEVRDYFEENGQSGRDRLMVEMAAGKIPDIIDLGGNLLSYYTLVQRGFLEDLWPYIENDPGLGREGVLEAPLKAAEVDGGLYTVFSSVMINTLAGARSIVRDRTGWTLEDLREAFSKMPEDATVLSYADSRELIFDYLFTMSLEGYVDRETGASSFTGEQFRSALQFVNSLPAADDIVLGQSDEDTMEKVVEHIFSGRQMLALAQFTRPRDLQLIDAYYGLGEPAVFIGYPTEDGSAGSFFQIRGDHVLAMSSVCQDKEAAWAFLRELLLPRFDSVDQIMEAPFVDIPVNRADYELLITCDRSRRAKGDQGLLMGPRVKFRKSTQEDVDRFEAVLNSTDRIALSDSILYDIVREAVSPYFAGDATLDETVQRIDSRVGLYLHEQT